MSEPPTKVRRTEAEEPAPVSGIIPTGEVLKFVESLHFTQPISVLEEEAVAARTACAKCGKRRQYFCYDCVKPTVPRALPRDVKLPVKVHVLLHKQEHVGKATSVHAGVLSSDVSLYVHPELPKGTTPDTTLLVYPSKDAKTLDQLAAEGTLDKVRSLVFIDSTWKQSRAICRDENVQQLGIPVQLNEYRTLFWRYQNTGDERFLATIEAIYYLLRDLQIARGNDYKGEFDDLLYYYVHQYAVIQERYKSESRAFTKRHQKSEEYIRHGADFSALLGRESKPAEPAGAEDKAQE